MSSLQPAGTPALDSETNSLADIFMRHANELRRFLHGRRGAHDAEDMVQDSFVRLIEQGQTQVISNPRAWLYRTGSNLATDAHDYNRVRSAVHVDCANIEAIADQTADPARIIEARQQANHLWDALQVLPEVCRHAFLLNRFDGLSQREIAQRLCISEKTVERHVLRALAACNRAVVKKGLK